MGLGKNVDNVTSGMTKAVFYHTGWDIRQATLNGEVTRQNVSDILADKLAISLEKFPSAKFIRAPYVKKDTSKVYAEVSSLIQSEVTGIYLSVDKRCAFARNHGAIVKYMASAETARKAKELLAVNGYKSEIVVE